MRPDHRWLVVFAGNTVFLFLVAQANHYLTNVPLFGLAEGQAYLFLPGLPLAFTALRLSLAPAVLATVATALGFAAVLPAAPTGAILIPATACVCITIALRANFNRFEMSTAVLVGLLANLVMHAAVTIATLAGGGVSLTRVLVDLALSQVALACLTGWFFAAQTALLKLFGFDIETELREPL